MKSICYLLLLVCLPCKSQDKLFKRKLEYLNVNEKIFIDTVYSILNEKKYSILDTTYQTLSNSIMNIFNKKGKISKVFASSKDLWNTTDEIDNKLPIYSFVSSLKKGNYQIIVYKDYLSCNVVLINISKPNIPIVEWYSNFNIECVNDLLDCLKNNRFQSINEQVIHMNRYIYGNEYYKW